jgi:hypothetical protein
VRARALLVACAAALAGAGAARSAGAVTETAHLRGWTTTLRIELREGGHVRALHLHASAAGRTRLDRNLPLPGICRDGGCPVLDGARVLELDDVGGFAPAAVLWLWTGGAHCCSVAQIVPLDGGPVVTRNFGNPGASVVHVDGTALFATEDDRFSYLYTSYAASARPLLLLRLRRGRFADVTASYRGRIGADARGLWSLVRQQVRRREEARGAFAAWAADACRLSGRARVEAAARPLVAAGAFSPPRTDLGSGPLGARFPMRLLRDLTRWGYCPPV